MNVSRGNTTTPLNLDPLETFRHLEQCYCVARRASRKHARTPNCSVPDGARGGTWKIARQMLAEAFLERVLASASQRGIVYRASTECPTRWPVCVCVFRIKAEDVLPPLSCSQWRFCSTRAVAPPPVPARGISKVFRSLSPVAIRPLLRSWPVGVLRTLGAMTSAQSLLLATT